jgi:hypothetical protein
MLKVFTWPRWLAVRGFNDLLNDLSVREVMTRLLESPNHQGVASAFSSVMGFLYADKRHYVNSNTAYCNRWINRPSGPVVPTWYLDPQSIMLRLRKLGVDLLGGRNSALQNLVAEVPPPLVAELLGYSYQVTQRHAELAAQPWARYLT